MPTQEEEKLLAELSPEARAATEKLLASNDRRAIVCIGAAMAILSAGHAFKQNQITHEQFYDIAMVAIQLIWNSGSNALATGLFKNFDEKQAHADLASILMIGIPAEQTAAQRLMLLTEMCKPQKPTTHGKEPK